MAENNIKIGPLEPNELAEADRIFRLAFGMFIGVPPGVTFMAGREMVTSRYPARHVKALAARENGRLIGSNLFTVWGNFAFFGPLTVLPEYWDKGVASKLLHATVAAFDRMKLHRTALFTFAHSTKHVGLYNKFGYWPQQLTALMRYSPEPVQPSAPPSLCSFFPLSTLPRAAREPAVDACRKPTNRIDKGLDLTEEIRSLLKHRIGEVILTFSRNILDGFAVACHGPGSEGGTEVCYLKFAAVRNTPGADGGLGADGRFDHLLDACDTYARSKGVSIEAGVNFACEGAYRRMRAHGYRAYAQGVAMQRPNIQGFNRPDAYVISDWR